MRALLLVLASCQVAGQAQPWGGTLAATQTIEGPSYAGLGVSALDLRTGGHGDHRAGPFAEIGVRFWPVALSLRYTAPFGPYYKGVEPTDEELALVFSLILYPFEHDP